MACDKRYGEDDGLGIGSDQRWTNSHAILRPRPINSGFFCLVVVDDDGTC
jgi:hypothetical protein